MLTSTHPVCSEIKSTNEAESVFDGISYGKGASFLKQVYNVMGYDNMKIALTNYFEKHQWQNTELSDFIASLQNAYDKSPSKGMGDNFDFKKWCDSWLITSGVNVLAAEPVFEAGAGHVDNLARM